MFGGADAGGFPAAQGGDGVSVGGGGVELFQDAGAGFRRGKPLLVGGGMAEEGGDEALTDAVAEGQGVVEGIGGLDDEQGGEKFFLHAFVVGIGAERVEGGGADGSPRSSRAA